MMSSNKTIKPKQPPKSIEECLTLSLIKIRKFFKRVETNNFSTGLAFDDDISEITDLNKAIEIYNFIRLIYKEKKKFFDTSKYNYINFEENIDKLRTRHGFDQANFSELIEKCKKLMEIQQEKNLYIEKLEQEIIILNNQKNAIVEKTTNKINEMKKDQLKLIDKISELSENGKLIDQGKHEILRKTQQLQERTQENINLKKEQKKLIQGFRREKTGIILNKNSEIKSLLSKLKYAESYRKNEIKEQNEKYKFKNKYKEVKLHIQTLMNENEVLACRVAQLTADNYALNENCKKLDKKLSNAISKLQFLANTPQFKAVKKTFFDMECKALNEAEEEINNNNKIILPDLNNNKIDK